jgi:hypothetical protein
MNDKIQLTEWIDLQKAAILRCLQDESMRDEMIENIVYANMENYFEFRNLEEHVKKLEKKLEKKLKDKK